MRSVKMMIRVLRAVVALPFYLAGVALGGPGIALIFVARCLFGR